MRKGGKRKGIARKGQLGLVESGIQFNRTLLFPLALMKEKMMKTEDKKEGRRKRRKADIKRRKRRDN